MVRGKTALVETQAEDPPPEERISQLGETGLGDHLGGDVVMEERRHTEGPPGIIGAVARGRIGFGAVGVLDDPDPVEQSEERDEGGARQRFRRRGCDRGHHREPPEVAN